MESTSAVRPGSDGAMSRSSAKAAARRDIDVRANLALTAAALLTLGYQLVGLPLLLRATGSVSFALLATLAPVVLATPIHWGLIHEGIHGQLLRSRRANEAFARLLAIGMAMPFDAVRFGHLMHHRFTREAFDRPDVDDARGPRWLRRLSWYVRLLGGLYVAEVFAPLLAFIPVPMARAVIEHSIDAHGAAGQQVQRLFSNHVQDPAKRSRARRDWLCSLVFYAGAFALYGKAWPVLVLAMYLRGLWLSVADNLPHYGVAMDEPGRSRDFRVPPGLGLLLMNHHLHRQHHLHPTLPWVALPELVESAPASERGAYWRAVFRQFRGLQPGTGMR